MKNEVKVISKCSIKNRTKSGDLCRQNFVFCRSNIEPGEITLVIHKFVLSNDNDLYWDYVKVRSFKDKTLFFQDFSIRMSTLKKAEKLLVENLKIV